MHSPAEASDVHIDSIKRLMMHGPFVWLRAILFGPPELPELEEISYPRDPAGRPDLRCFSKPVQHYIDYVEDYLASLSPDAFSSESERWRKNQVNALRAHAYQKGVLGEWGLIARGPDEAFPFVLALLSHALPEGRRAAAGVLDAWAASGDARFSSAVLGAAYREASAHEPDPELLSVLMETLGRLRVGYRRPYHFLRAYCGHRGRVSAT